ncbi:MAG: PilZ domain-containing protein [Candidatus Kaelpia aquatica]|nr:PilZ domain-containing protein [Candidatus Kaelpia aquatica]
MDSDSSVIERRRHKRFKVNFTAVCTTQELFKSRTIVEPRDIIVKMFDISDSGAGFISDYDFSPKTNVETKFTLVNLGARETKRYSPMSITGEVCYNFPFREDLHRFGVSFRNVAPQERRAISSFIDTLLD